MTIVNKIAWLLGFTYSPSRRIWDGHGYSWIGRKVRRLRDAPVSDAIEIGYRQGMEEARRR